MKRYEIDLSHGMGVYARMKTSIDGPYVKHQDAARIRAQRDRLAELLDQAHQHCSVNGHCELGEEWFDCVKKELAELDKEKTNEIP